ncbi:MAG: hypothetical protein NTZ97_03330 [Candidatus Moranbacteria bacterium]|nr:hypothetical protein [Candidatus Moranbacteria bacterium]
MSALILHIIFHFLLSLLAGVIVWKLFNHPLLSVLSAIIGGVFVDFDHFFDYFIAFGLKFNLSYFINGYQFLKTDKLYLLFHGWEYVVILLILALVLKNRTSRTARTIWLGLALGLLFHLIADVNLNKIPASTYFISYRAVNNFDLKKLVTPEHWERHLILKKDLPYIN